MNSIFLDPCDYMTEDQDNMFVTTDMNMFKYNIEDMKKFVGESLYSTFLKVLEDMYKEVQAAKDADSIQDPYIYVNISRICESCAEYRIDREKVISMLMCIVVEKNQL